MTEPNFGNPLINDLLLKQYLAEFPPIDTRREFDRWRNCFLDRYETFLDDTGVGGADDAYGKYVIKLTAWTKQMNKIQADIAAGHLTVAKCSVSARTRLIEFQK
jgi:hypothetical protein